MSRAVTCIGSVASVAILNLTLDSIPQNLPTVISSKPLQQIIQPIRRQTFATVVHVLLQEATAV